MALFELKDIDMIYNKGKDNEVHAIKKASLQIQSGDFIALVGASGSGKSTLLQIIGGMLKPTDGEYSFMGEEITHLNDNQLAHFRNENVGYVLQDYGLLRDRSVIENVCLPMMFSKMRWRDIEARAHQVLSQLHIDKLGNRRINQLSGGQSQLVAIARALVMKAPVILADEPTGSLDSVTAIKLIKLLQAMNKEGVTIIIVTHNEAISNMCNRVIPIHDGYVGKQHGACV